MEENLLQEIGRHEIVLEWLEYEFDITRQPKEKYKLSRRIDVTKKEISELYNLHRKTVMKIIK